jgi:glycosyltransferase involved in cell wall biosynthesis
MLAYLIEHPKKTKEKKVRARRYVLKNYSWDRITDQMEALYLSLLPSNT